MMIDSEKIDEVEHNYRFIDFFLKLNQLVFGQVTILLHKRLNACLDIVYSSIITSFYYYIKRTIGIPMATVLHDPPGMVK